MNRSRIFYIGMVNTQGLAIHLQEDLFIGAATRKMCGVNRALRTSGARSWIVSLPSLGTSAQIVRMRTFVETNKNAPGIFLGVARNRWFRKLFGSVRLFWFCVTKVRRSDHVIFYNAEFEYAPAALWLFLRKNFPILDVEDIPIAQQGVRERIRKIYFLVFQRACRNKILAVSRQVAANMGARSCFIIYGLHDETLAQQSRKYLKKWDALEQGGELIVHYGGSLMHDTGLTLFCDAMKRLAQQVRANRRRVRIIVTSHQIPNEIKLLSEQLMSSALNFEFFSLNDHTEMIGILMDCHASLSLKLSDSGFSATTFPSKVIEICSAGTLLITTRASDIPTLFDATNCAMLGADTPAALCKEILDIDKNPGRARIRAMNGQAFIKQNFSEQKVGRDLVQFINGGILY